MYIYIYTHIYIYIYIYRRRCVCVCDEYVWTRPNKYDTIHTHTHIHTHALPSSFYLARTWTANIYMQSAIYLARTWINKQTCICNQLSTLRARVRSLEDDLAEARAQLVGATLNATSAHGASTPQKPRQESLGELLIGEQAGVCAGTTWSQCWSSYVYK